MPRNKVFGKCHICGTHAKLSFEHVPPEAAFNNHRVVGKHIFELINKNPDHYFDGKGHISQRGAGAYTLCEKCNNNTGRWYGDAFASLAHQMKCHPLFGPQFRKVKRRFAARIP